MDTEHKHHSNTNAGFMNQNLRSQEDWETILQYKQIFLNNISEDPHNFPYMQPEVVESWIRSKKLGVNPQAVVAASKLNAEELAEIMNQHRGLIDITEAIVKPFIDMFRICGYILYLIDKNNVILLQEGEWGESHPLLAKKSRTGIIADENAEGTTAHELCIRLKRPVQLLGPEHYCEAFQDVIASAVPIRNEAGDVDAALVLIGYPFQNWSEAAVLQSICMHSLGLATTMAMAIETQLRYNSKMNEFNKTNEKATAFEHNLQAAKHELTTIHNTLNATMLMVDDGIITIDSNGRIISTNQEAIRILKLRQEEIGSRNISEFLSSESCVMSFAKKGENITIEENLNIGNDKQLYQINIRPIVDQTTHELDIAVLKLISFEKVTAQSNNRTGGITTYIFDDLVGESKELKNAIELGKRFACSQENVLIIGESGTGKELFAQAIHNLYRHQGPFMAVSCAAMPRELIESELFGYEGGSFTGAERSGRPGKIELANGGTLFLDEIGDMPLELQAVLLRVLEDKQVMRVGGQRYKKIDFKLIAATNKDLYKMVKEGIFREDLYFRLSVLYIPLPPLRERGNDVEILSRFFIKKYCQKLGWSIPEISPAVLAKIKEYKWPGNVRQLQNAMIYAVNTNRGETIKIEHLPNYILMDTSPLKFDQSTGNEGNIGDMLCLETLEKAAIETALVHAGNIIPDAAVILGISRSTLYRKLKDYNIEH